MKMKKQQVERNCLQRIRVNKQLEWVEKGGGEGRREGTFHPSGVDFFLLFLLIFLLSLWWPFQPLPFHLLLLLLLLLLPPHAPIS